MLQKKKSNNTKETVGNVSKRRGGKMKLS